MDIDEIKNPERLRILEEERKEYRKIEDQAAEAYEEVRKLERMISSYYHGAVEQQFLKSAIRHEENPDDTSLYDEMLSARLSKDLTDQQLRRVRDCKKEIDKLIDYFHK